MDNASVGFLRNYKIFCFFDLFSPLLFHTIFYVLIILLHIHFLLLVEYKTGIFYQLYHDISPMLTNEYIFIPRVTRSINLIYQLIIRSYNKLPQLAFSFFFASRKLIEIN